MNWRAYILHAVIGGALVGIILGIIIQPIKNAILRHRGRKGIAEKIARVPQDKINTRPDDKYIPHKKWNIPRPNAGSYYTSSRD